MALGRLLSCVCSLVVSHLHSWFVVHGSISEDQIELHTSTWTGHKRNATVSNERKTAAL